MNAGIERKTTTWLFNPFVYIAGGQALGLGLAAILVAGFIGSVSNSHFDGVLDTHTGMSAPIWFFLAEGFIDWFCLALVLCVFGKIISKTAFRTIDLFGTQALARWPTILVQPGHTSPGFPEIQPRIGRPTNASGKKDRNKPNRCDRLLDRGRRDASVPLLGSLPDVQVLQRLV